MKLNSEEVINVFLNWDYSGNKRETGVYQGEEEEFTSEIYTIYFDLYINVEIENDNGDYWSPPTFDITSEVIEISNMKVYDLLDEELILEDEELTSLIIELENKITYE